jgi:hypothetical protein
MVEWSTAISSIFQCVTIFLRKKEFSSLFENKLQLFYVINAKLLKFALRNAFSSEPQ